MTVLYLFRYLTPLNRLSYWIDSCFTQNLKWQILSPASTLWLWPFPELVSSMARWSLVRSVIYTVSQNQRNCLRSPDWIHRFINLVISRHREPEYPSVVPGYYAMPLWMQLTMLLKTALLSRLIMMPRKRKAEPTTMPLDTVPASLSESSGRCSLTK